MAIFHLDAKVISRGQAQSAIAAAAYRSGERLRDEQADQTKYYPSRLERIVFTDIMAPQDAPEWAHNRNQLWNEAERAEKRKDAQLAREFEVSLPHELTEQQREWLVKDFAREAFVRRGYVVDIAIHAPDEGSDKRNHHAHLMVTMRELGPDGFAAKKDRSLNSTEQLKAWREQWANLANRHLERHGHEARIDHRNLKDQGIEREPGVHLGYAANGMAQRGAQSDRMDELAGIMARNEIRIDIAALDRAMTGLQRQANEQQVRPIEVIARDHAEADEEAARKSALKQLRAAARADAQKQRAEDTIEVKFADAAQAAAQRVRQDRREERAQAQQKAWRKKVDKEIDRADKGTLKTAETGFQVVNSATGALSKLGDFVSDLLASASPAPAQERPVDMTNFVSDPAARREHYQAQAAARESTQRDETALEQIGADMKAGRSFKSEDIANLTREHQEAIKIHGDDAVRQMVDDARKRAEGYWKGDGRERYQDR